MSWISVDESLPSFRERVLVVEERKGVPPSMFISRRIPRGGEVWSWAGVSQDKDIKYWQKLPDFPRK